MTQPFPTGSPKYVHGLSTVVPHPQETVPSAPPKTVNIGSLDTYSTNASALGTKKDTEVTKMKGKSMNSLDDLINKSCQ